MVKYLGIHFIETISMLCDNTNVINISKNPFLHSHTKNIAIRYHFLKDKVTKGKVKLDYDPKIEQVEDIFIKIITKGSF